MDRLCSSVLWLNTNQPCPGSAETLTCLKAHRQRKTTERQLRIVASFAPKKDRHHFKKTVSKLGMVVQASKPGWSRRIATSSKLTWTTKPDPNSKQTKKMKDLLMKWKEVIDDLIYREKISSNIHTSSWICNCCCHLFLCAMGMHICTCRSCVHMYM